MTVTSNIHVGLAGWSNTTYSVGQRRSNAGNAYQVVTAGTSTSPPTGTGSSITPGGTSAWKWLSAVDYSTLQAWAGSIPTTLTQPIIGLVWNDGVITATAGTAILTLSGHTTSGTNTITLAPATGEGFLAKFQAAPTTPYQYNNANGVSIEFPSSGFGGINYIQIDDNNVIFRGMQVKDLNASSGATMIGGLGAIWIDKCLIEGQSQPSGARMLQMGAASIKITNSLIIDHSVGNPDSATIEAVGTGCAIAYTTIVKTSPATGSAALDANTNSTVASNTVTGCIFVGYDVPFIAASAQVWTTNHNAYTNSFFTSTVAATDTGGSIFNATPASLFVSFTSSNPFSAEFSNEFGGGSVSVTDYHQNPTSPCLNAGVTDTTDIPTADDTFGISRPQGANWDIGPHELLSGSVILRDFIIPSVFTKTIGRDSVAPIAWNYGFARNVQIQIEQRQPIISSCVFQLENKTSFPYLSLLNPFSSDFSSDFGDGASWVYDPQTAIEFRSGVPFVTRDTSFPLEWRVGVAADRPITDEWRSNAQQDAGSGIEWRSTRLVDSVVPSGFSRSVNLNVVAPTDRNYGISRIIGAELESRKTAVFDNNLPVEAKASFPFLSLPDPFSSDFSSDFGGGSSWIYDPPIPIEFGSVTPHALRDVSFPLDWTAVTFADQSIADGWSAAFTGLTVSSAEFIGSVQSDTISLVGWNSALRGGDYVVSLEAKGTIASDAVHYIDRMAPFAMDVAVPVDFVISVINTAPAFVEFTQATALTITAACDPYLLIMADKIGALESSASRTADVLMPTEIGGGTGVGIPADSVLALEWRGGVMVDAPIGASASISVQSDLVASVSSDSLKVIDYAIGSAFGSTTLMTEVAPSEWGHLTLGAVADMASFLEILATVRVDVRVPNHRLVGRKSIGSQLEPDEFELENEPPC